MEDTNSKTMISLLDAVDFLEKAWRNVSSLTIENCFRHAKLCKSETAINVNDNDEDDISLSELIKRLQGSENRESLLSAATKYETVDEGLIVYESYTDADIVGQIKSPDNKSIDDKEDEEETSEVENTVPSYEEARSAIKVLKHTTGLGKLQWK